LRQGREAQNECSRQRGGGTVKGFPLWKRLISEAPRGGEDKLHAGQRVWGKITSTKLSTKGGKSIFSRCHPRRNNNNLFLGKKRGKILQKRFVCWEKRERIRKKNRATSGVEERVLFKCEARRELQAILLQGTGKRSVRKRKKKNFRTEVPVRNIPTQAVSFLKNKSSGVRKGQPKKRGGEKVPGIHWVGRDRCLGGGRKAFRLHLHIGETLLPFDRENPRL